MPQAVREREKDGAGDNKRDRLDAEIPDGVCHDCHRGGCACGVHMVERYEQDAEGIEMDAMLGEILGLARIQTVLIVLILFAVFYMVWEDWRW